jgi:hypothetical protein
MKRLSLAVVMLAVACAGEGPVYEDKYAYDDGWRVGKVTHVVSSEASIDERSSKDCRLGARAEGHGARTFARVSLQWGRYYRSIVAMVPRDEPVSVGEEVYVDFQDCGQELAPRHKRRTR